jgi:hypothetical protein
MSGFYYPINNEAITNVYNGAITTSATVTDLPVAGAKFVDLTGNKIAIWTTSRL